MASVLAQAHALGEIPNLSRVDDGDGQAGVNNVADQRAFVSTRRFDDDHLQSGKQAEFVDQLSESLGVVGASESPCQRTHMNVELVFGNVDADPGRSSNVRIQNGIIPVLQMRTRAGSDAGTVLAAVRAWTKGAPAILLCDGVLNTRARSICRAPGSLRLFACAQSRRLPGLHCTLLPSFRQHTRHREEESKDKICIADLPHVLWAAPDRRHNAVERRRRWHAGPILVNSKFRP